jgi:putative ABC transport system ATP-binding protein
MNLIPTLTALENVALPLLFQGVPDDERAKRAKELLTQVKLEERMNHKPGQMSGGEQQRVALAAALINDPTLIIADEPTGNLDTKTAEEIIDMFKTINQVYPDKTIIIVSHDRAFRRIANRILFIKDGVIIDEQTPDSLSKELDNLAPTVQDEIQKYQQHIMELERKLRRMEQVFKS